MGRYSQEFKEEAVDIALTSGRSHHDIAVDLGINPSTFRNWVNEAMMTLHPSDSPPRKPSKKSYSDLERELRAMKKELALRQQEIELLKKASVDSMAQCNTSLYNLFWSFKFQCFSWPLI